MRRRTSWMLALTAIVLSGVSALALTIALPPGWLELQHQEAAATSPRGASRTVLPDGRILEVGVPSGQSPAAVLVESTGRRVPTANTPTVPRTWHTATLLPDGTVLLLGGVDTTGQPVSTAEMFDPVTGQFFPTWIGDVAPRTHHTTTVLSTGELLIVGGRNADGSVVTSAELVDPLSQRVTPLPESPATARADATAHLLPDGQVRVSGGTRADETTAGRDVLFDPSTQQFVPAPVAESAPQTVPAVTATFPAPGATGVARDVRVMVRFSTPVVLSTLTPESVVVTSTVAPVDALVVPVEGGRLLFITPRAPLDPDTLYTVTVNGVRDVRGQALPPLSFHFITAADDEALAEGPIDDEAWQPEFAEKWRTDRPPSPWQQLPPLTAPDGTTALAGQVLRLNGKPLAHVTLRINGNTAETDRTGRFLLVMKSGGSGRAVLEIDGATANRPKRTYGFFEAAVTLTAGRTTVLPYTVWMPLIDTAHSVTIGSPTSTEAVIRTPYIPGLELHIPGGTVLRGHDGRPVTRVSITPIPVDRTPFPLPKNVDVPVYFTIQPGGAYVYASGPGAKHGAQLVYPNYRKEYVGKRIQFFHYDPRALDWYVYGLGTVAQGGAQVFPDPTTRLYEFTGAMINSGATPPAEGPGDAQDGDPVDLGTGLFVYEKTDLYLADVLPIALTRVYRTSDVESRPFGIGATHPYAMFLWSAQQYQEADLVLPNGKRIHYVRTSPGVGYGDAVFEHVETATTSATPTRFYRSRIAWNGDGWNLRLKDGLTYVFGENSPLRAIRDRYGNEIRIELQSGGKVYRIVSPNGRCIEFTYGTGGRISQAKDNIGRTVSYTYDASGRLWKVTDAANQVTEFTYDSEHRMKTIKDPRNIVYLTNEYDANGRVRLQTQADSTTYQFAWTVDANQNVTQAEVTNPRNTVTRYGFNADHFVTSVTEAVGTSLERTTTFVRPNRANFITSITDPLNRVTNWTYDGFGNVTSITRLAGTTKAVTTTITWHPAFALPASVTDPLQHTWSFGYDSRGNLTSMTDPLSHESTATYDGAGLIQSFTDPLQHTTGFGYKAGLLTNVTDPLGNAWKAFRDPAGRILSTTEPLGRLTRYEIDVLNRVTKTVDARGGETVFTWDPNGNLLSLRDPNLSVTSWTYDAMDRVATRRDPLLRSEAILYDANGNFRQATDRKQQVTTAIYDALDRPATITFNDGSTITYAFDAGDRLQQVTDSTNGTITRGYDDLDRLTSEVTAQGTVGYTYDAAERRSTMSVTGQPTTTYAYDDADRLTNITQGVSAVGIAYDDAGRRTSLTFPNGVLTTYDYDDSSRVTGITYQYGATALGTLTYEYDGGGNPTAVGGSWARTGLPQTALGTYDAAHQIATWNARPHRYDANGNLLEDGYRSFIWNARNELASVSGPIDALLQYDGLGRRRARGINGLNTTFLYNGLDVVREQSNGVSADILSSGLDQPLIRTTPAGSSALLADRLGSILAATDPLGAVSSMNTYEPFGRVLASGSNSSGNKFTGREVDDASLYFYRARYYDPVASRFISDDPIAFAGGDLNLHAYVANRPTVLVDPTGRDAYSPGVTGGVAGFGFWGSLSLGLVWTTSGDFGVQLSLNGGGGGALLPNGSVGGGFQWSPEAVVVGDLDGSAAAGGASVVVPGVPTSPQGSYDWSGGRNSAGKLINTHQFGAAWELGGKGAQPFETHAGAGYTWTMSRDKATEALRAWWFEKVACIFAPTSCSAMPLSGRK